MAPSTQAAGASTRALHADDVLNVVTDVAPPLHLSTTFRYPDNPDELVPCSAATVWFSIAIARLICHIWKESDSVSV